MRVVGVKKSKELCFRWIFYMLLCLFIIILGEMIYFLDSLCDIELLNVLVLICFWFFFELGVLFCII